MSSIRLVNEIVRRQKIQGDIALHIKKIAKLKQEQQNLSSLIEYFSTEAYIEEQARKKFNLTKPGETVVIVPQPSDSPTESRVPRTANNIALWWDYFFHPDAL